MNTTLTQSEKVVWINVPLPAGLRKQIKLAAAERDQTSRELVVDAVKAFIEPSDAKPKRKSA